MATFTVDLDDQQVSSLRYLVASTGETVDDYIKRLVVNAANATSGDLNYRVIGLGLNNPDKEARIRAILEE